MKKNRINFNNKTILITGGAGFIGSNLAFYFQDNFPDSKVIVFDCFRNTEVFENGNLKSFGHYENLINFQGQIICGNINNKTDLALLDDYKFDYIFHQAAISDTRIYDQELVMKTNVNSFYDILRLAKKINLLLSMLVRQQHMATCPLLSQLARKNLKIPMDIVNIKWIKSHSNSHLKTQV